jgi:hypothetical protein
MNKKILADLEFDRVIGESMAQTATGSNLLNKYKTWLMANESTCSLVNNFIKEASQCRYDNGVNAVLENVLDYVASNKTSWALASAVEKINENDSRYNYLNRNAASQVEKLLEMDEENVVKYIKAGALKNVMYCEAFRNIAKQVYASTPMVEATAEYTCTHPVSLVENTGDGYCFEVRGRLFKIADDKSVQEAEWKEVSNTFKTVSELLESNLAEIDENNIYVTVGNNAYIINECGKCIKCQKKALAQLKGACCKDPEVLKACKAKEMTCEQLREDSAMVVATTNQRFKYQIAGQLEAVAQLAENYDNVASLDNVSIYETSRDKFFVIENGTTDIYATSLASKHLPSPWTINENVVSALSFIKSKTNVELGEKYNTLVENYMEKSSEEDRQKVEEELQTKKVSDIKTRISDLTEKFKNDPVKLAVLSQLAQELNEAE